MTFGVLNGLTVVGAFPLLHNVHNANAHFIFKRKMFLFTQRHFLFSSNSVRKYKSNHFMHMIRYDLGKIMTIDENCIGLVL